MDVETWTDEDGLNYISCSLLQQGDYCGASYCEANIRALEDTEGAVIRHGHYYSRQLWLPDNDENRDVLAALADYPCWDDEEVSRVEMEWEEAAWKDYGIADLRNTYQRGDRPALADVLDALSAEDAFACYLRAMEAENAYPTFEDSGASLPLDRIAEAFAALAVGVLASAGGDCDASEDVADAVREHVACVSEGHWFNGDYDHDDVAERLIAADWCADNGHEALADYLRRLPV